MAAKDLIQLDGEPLDLVLLVFSCGIWRSMMSGGMRWLQKVLPYSWFWSHIGFWRREKAEALHAACFEILLYHIHIPH